MSLRQPDRESPIAAALSRTRGVMLAVGIFSAVVNILGLNGSLYMLQVYDRVLASRSVPTLIALSLLVFGLYVLQGVLEVVRGQVMSRVGLRVERDLLKPVHDLVLRLPMLGRPPAEVTQPVRDMESVRNFMASQAPLAFLDLPWAPVYLAVVFMLHPWLGMLALGGTVALALIAGLTEIRLRHPNHDLTAAAGRRHLTIETARRNVEVMRAMGFADRAADRFFKASGDLFAASQRIADVTATLGTLSRVFRMILQSAILGLGAYLVIGGQITAGGIIAASILAGRATAPVEMVIANWKLFVAARQARARLQDSFRLLGGAGEPIDLPPAKAHVALENVTVGPPGARMPTLRNARLVLKAGDGLAVLGPSGAGKSTLARAMVGAWPLAAGVVRLDGAPLDQWPTASLGRLIGYLPQDVELFDGTVAANIARLDDSAEDAAIVAAAQAANVHEMILRLPEGYSTVLGEGGCNLSVGQRQRIGLARALYGAPFLVVLDEPNAHLDQEGDAALARAIVEVRRRGGIVVAISHRRSILEHLNLAALVAEGEIRTFGPRDEVLKRIAEQVAAGPSRTPGAAPRRTAAPAAGENPVYPFPDTRIKLQGRLGGVGPQGGAEPRSAATEAGPTPALDPSRGS